MDLGLHFRPLLIQPDGRQIQLAQSPFRLAAESNYGAKKRIGSLAISLGRGGMVNFGRNRRVSPFTVVDLVLQLSERACQFAEFIQDRLVALKSSQALFKFSATPRRLLHCIFAN